MKCPFCAREAGSWKEAVDIQLAGKCFDCQMRGASIFGDSEFSRCVRQELVNSRIVDTDNTDSDYVN